MTLNELVAFCRLRGDHVDITKSLDFVYPSIIEIRHNNEIFTIKFDYEDDGETLGYISARRASPHHTFGHLSHDIWNLRALERYLL